MNLKSIIIKELINKGLDIIPKIVNIFHNKQTNLQNNDIEAIKKLIIEEGRLLSSISYDLEKIKNILELIKKIIYIILFTNILLLIFLLIFLIK
ncbi:MAG: hypothetical protein N2446_02640 [Elusimicrobiales bacterium]|nr:hypothetical protein [Elusimicrobiales bacterium]